ncbi:DUF4367 domain-containing protein [Blautia sp.]|uniref:DUF4367 domain-containing protein n=1 Tax=Blautia sp. TaxID=1955243 RepID=UPI002E7A8597|nr:DUF4367 domain-containing protein [Blautia sp.]
MRKEFKRNKKQKNNQSSDKKDRHRLFLDEQYIKMAEEMERELFADVDSDAYESTDEEEARSYQRLINSLKADGIYQEDDAEPDIGKKVVPMHRKIRFGKVAGVAILCCACIFAVSMTSEANRTYLINNIRVWSGNDTRTVIDNNEKNETVNMKEYEAIEEIEEKLDIDMPEFYYRPYGLEFYGYEVDITSDIAKMEYLYKDNIIYMLVDKQTEETASKITSVQGNKHSRVIIGNDGTEISIECVQEKGDFLPSYTALWKRENVVYCFSGRLEEAELEKIFEDMVF